MPYIGIQFIKSLIFALPAAYSLPRINYFNYGIFKTEIL